MKKILIFVMSFLFSSFLIGAYSMGKSASPVVEHYVKYSNKGTRSEARSGYLKVNGFIVPDNFVTVVAGGNIYHFYMRKYMWGNDGYFPDKNSDAAALCPAIERILSSEELARGWAIVDGWPINTPSQWIYVIWKNGSAVVAPEKIDEFIKRNNIVPLPRSLMLENLMK